MEINLKEKRIVFDKVLNELDRFAIDFVNILEKYARYVFVSGYVSILLGRSRSSEDIDILVEKIDASKFMLLFNDLQNKGFECANTSNSFEAYEMLNEFSIRFYRNNMPLPNMEFRFINNDIQKEAFDNRIRVILREKDLFISPIELQIAYKLSLMAQGDFQEISSDKDFEDAKHLYEFCKDKLDIEKLIYYVKLFKVEKFWGWLQK